MISLNTTDAAIKAGYSAKSARAIGNENLQKPYIKNYLESRMKKKEERTEISQDQLLELKRIAFFDPRKLFDMKGRLKKITELDEDTRAAITSYDVSSHNDKKGDANFEQITKIRFLDKIKALELLCRHLGILQDNIKVKVDTFDQVRVVNLTSKLIEKLTKGQIETTAEDTK